MMKTTTQTTIEALPMLFAGMEKSARLAMAHDPSLKLFRVTARLSDFDVSSDLVLAVPAVDASAVRIAVLSIVAYSHGWTIVSIEEAAAP